MENIFRLGFEAYMIFVKLFDSFMERHHHHYYYHYHLNAKTDEDQIAQLKGGEGTEFL